jgi:hypothetical protein
MYTTIKETEDGKLTVVSLPLIEIGDYTLVDVDEQDLLITHKNGETGRFRKNEFEAHIAAFFGLNF